ncbi:hypothetical protein Tco_0236470 [Tanacetum coccineum]
MVNEGITLDAGLDSEASTDDNTSSEKQDGSSNSGYYSDVERAWVDKALSDLENAAVGPSYDNDTLTKILRDIRKKEKHLEKETTNESEYCKNISLLNKEISNLKSQACQKEKSFHKETEKYAQNEHLHKDNEHLKKTYKDLYDSIKKTRVQTTDHHDSLIAQLNKKSIENVDLNAQIQEKVFAIAALKKELRKLKGNSVDTKFEKPSILGKPPLQPLRNQSVVRQLNVFKCE